MPMTINSRNLGSAKSVATTILALSCMVLGVAFVPRGAISPVRADFVTRSGGKLMFSGHAFRFSGANIYWGGLDENGRMSLNYPTKFRVDSALKTVADMGGTVVRCQTCGISTGNPSSVEPSLGVFNETALRHIDYFVAEAQKYHIRLVIPLTGNYAYYLGGYHNFTDWLGLSTARNCPSATCASIFYGNLKVIAAFKDYVSKLLNHVNFYNGIPNKDNPTIMSWEIGNEMPYGNGGMAELSNWTSTMSSFIKSIASNQLVMDGALTLDPDDLLISTVDIQDQHFYPLSTWGLDYVASRVAAARQALIVGEYDWNDSPRLSSFLTDIHGTRSISGDLYWDFLPQNDYFGYVQHYDGYQLHFPGDNLDVGIINIAPVASAVTDAPLAAELRRHAYDMSGFHAPPYPVPAAPVITNVEHVASATAGDGNLIEWQGSADAMRYVVRRSDTGRSGSWAVVGAVSADSTEEPFLDRNAGVGPDLWYRITAVSQAGITGGTSAPFQLLHHTLDDNLNNFSDAFSHTSGVAIVADKTKLPLYGGDRSRAEFLPNAHGVSIGWHRPAVQTFEALCYFNMAKAGRFVFLLSKNGSDWTRVPGADVQANQEAMSAGKDWAFYVYTIDNLHQILPGATYIEAQRAGNAPGIAELGEVRITYLWHAPASIRADP